MAMWIDGSGGVGLEMDVCAGASDDGLQDSTSRNLTFAKTHTSRAGERLRKDEQTRHLRQCESLRFLLLTGVRVRRTDAVCRCESRLHTKSFLLHACARRSRRSNHGSPFRVPSDRTDPVKKEAAPLRGRTDPVKKEATNATRSERRILDPDHNRKKNFWICLHVCRLQKRTTYIHLAHKEKIRGE